MGWEKKEIVMCFFSFFFFKQEPGLASGSTGELTSDQVPKFPLQLLCAALPGVELGIACTHLKGLPEK